MHCTYPTKRIAIKLSAIDAHIIFLMNQAVSDAQHFNDPKMGKINANAAINIVLKSSGTKMFHELNENPLARAGVAKVIALKTGNEKVQAFVDELYFNNKTPQPL